MVHGGGGLRIGGGSGGSGGSGTTMPINPSLARLTEALREYMDKIYCSEVLRSLLRRTPVTMPTLLTVRRCLQPVPAEEITRFLVREGERGKAAVDFFRLLTGGCLSFFC